jgi:hypothetical protein
MAVPAEHVMTWAAGHSPDRIAAVGVLAIRPRRYLSDGVALGLTPIPGLRVRVPDREETPIWHQSTGLYGFLRLPPGTARVEVSDPAGRYLPQALTAAVTNRQSVRAALEAGEVPDANAPRPLYLDVALRPAIDFAVPPGTAAIWGLVRGRDDRRPVPGALVGLDTVLTGVADRVTGMSGPDGCYLLVLPGEAMDRGVAPPVRRFDRRLTVEAPRPPLAAALAGPQGYLRALPPGVFGLSDADRTALFQVRDFQLRPAVGALRERVNDQNPLTTVSIGERVRWDIELFP